MLLIIKNRFMDNQIELLFLNFFCVSSQQFQRNTKLLSKSITEAPGSELHTKDFLCWILFPDEFLINNKQFQPDPVDIYGHEDVVFFIQT